MVIKSAFDKLLVTSVNEDEWSTSAASMKIFYDQSRRTLQVPAAIIRESLYYSYHWPNFLKYSRLGTILAHHLNHAIDSIGITFDSNGNLAKEPCISKEM